MLLSPRSYLKRYALTVLSVAIATLLMLVINPWSAMSQTPFLLYWGAITVSAWYGGIRPGLVATALAALISTYLFLPPIYTWELDIDNSIKLTLFVVQGVLISALCEALLRAKKRAEQNLRSLKLNEEALQQNEAKLRHSEEKSQILYENVPQIMWITKADGDVEYFNQRWYNYTGLSPEESLGWGWQQALHPEDLPLTLEKWLTGINTGNAVEVQYRLKGSNGAYRWHITRAVPLRDTQGVVSSWFGTCIDIHEQKLAEQEQAYLRNDLEAERKLLETVIQQVPAAVIIAEAPSGRLLLSNPQVEQIIQGSIPILEKIDDYVRYPAFYPNGQPYKSQETPLARAILTQEIVIDEEIKLLCGDGVLRTILASASPIRDDRGQIIAAVATFYDITKRKRSEMAFRESEERFRLATKAAEMGMWFWDLVEGELVWTEKCKALFGLSPETKISYEVFINSLHPDDRSYTHEAVNRALKERVDYDVEYRTVWPDGSLHWIAAKGRGFYDHTTGQVVRMMGTTQDITIRKRTEQRLATQYAVTRIIAEATITTTTISSILRSLCETLGWQVGIIWSVDRQANLLRYVESWHLPTRTDVESFIEISREKTFIPGKGLPGLIWERNRPAWVSDIAEGENFLRSVLADEAGLRGAFGFPIRIENQVLGVIECFSDNIQTPDTDLLQMMDAIGTQIGQFIERKQAEEALRSEKERFELAASALNCSIYDWDLISNRVERTEGLIHVIGFLPAEVEPTKDWWQSRIHPNDFSQAETKVLADLAKSNRYAIEYRFLNKDNQYVYLMDQGIVIRETQGKAIRVVGSTVNITERKQAEAALQESQELFECFMNHSPLTAFIKDEAGRYIYINTLGESLINRQPSDWIGKTDFDFFVQETAQQVRDNDLAVLTTSQTIQVLEKVSLEDGEYTYLSYKFPLQDRNGRKLIAGMSIDITEQMRTQEALRASEARFRSIFECNMVGMGVWATTGELLEANDALLDLIGYTRQELETGQISWQKLTPPEYHHLDRIAIAEMNVKNFCTSYEKEYIHKSGRRVPILIGAALFQDESGQGIFFAVDLTERKKVEEALRESMAILKAINEGTPTLIFVKDRQGHLIMANSSTVRAIGQPEAQILGRTDIEYQSNREYARQIMENDRSIMATGEMKVFEETVELPDGTRTFLSIKSPFQDRQGNIIGLIGVAVDVTERMLAEKALHQSEERFRQYADNINDVLWMSEPQAKQVLYVSPAYEKIWGRSCESLYANFAEWVESIHPDDREQVRSVFLSEILAGKYDKEYRVVRPDGSICWVRDRGFRIKTEPEMPERVAGIAEDITERKQAEAALQERTQELIEVNNILTNMTALLQKRNQELDQFAYIVSHDLKAPLRAIANLSQWIQDDLEEQLPEENQKQMQLLRDRVYRMENLINGLLEYSRVGRMENTLKTVDVAQLLTEVIDSLAPPATFRITINSGMPTLTTPELPLQQVFANLLSNAIKHHGRSDGHVQISVTKQKDYYQFAVADDGQGIPPEHHDRIFGIFQTSRAGDNKENTGIGLAIVKKIVETQGGTITVVSELDKGTTFCFTWPKQPK